jgi:hypothetical protein
MEGSNEVSVALTYGDLDVNVKVVAASAGIDVRSKPQDFGLLVSVIYKVLAPAS